MKLQELQPIDWVMYSQKSICRIYELDHQFQLVRCHKNSQEWTASPDEIEPIKLTEQMLEDNGFEYDGYGSYTIDFGNECSIELGIVSPNRFTLGGCYDIVIVFDYVHQLQNFLRLIGQTEAADTFRLNQYDIN